MKKCVILWGASGHAKVILGALDHQLCHIVGLIDRDATIQTLREYPVFRSLRQLYEAKPMLVNEKLYFIVAIGGMLGCDRLAIHQQLSGQGLWPLTVIHPTAWVDSSAEIAPGAQILAHAVVNADAKIGQQTIINSNAVVEHESLVAEGCHIMPSATVTGCVTIHPRCTVGSNATILPRVTLESDSVIGAGAVVTMDTKAHSCWVGMPAKPMIRKMD